MVAFKIEQFKSQIVFCSGQPSYRHTLCSNFLEFPSHCLRAQSNLHFCSVSGLFVTMGKQVFVIKKVLQSVITPSVILTRQFVRKSWQLIFCQASFTLPSPGLIFFLFLLGYSSPVLRSSGSENIPASMPL